MKLATLLSATALAGSLLLSPTIASAQTAAPTADTQDESTDKKADSEEIVVVGSHIKRSQFNTADSVQVITREDSTQAGFTTTAEVLQSTAVTGGTSQINNSYGGYVTAGGPGANTVSLRGLGTSRTLVLMNGRRISPSGSRGNVVASDLNVLPNIVVDRIEILNTGASSIYGSDAVAGVINLVTRSKFSGLQLEANHSVPQEGGGTEQRYSALFGGSSGAFSFLGSVEYYDRKEVTIGQRDWATCQTDNRLTTPSSYIDPTTGQPKCYGNTSITGANGVTINTLGTPNYNGTTVALGAGVPAGYGALPTTAGYGAASAQVCNRFRPNAAVTTGALPGYECVGGGALSISIRDLMPKSILKSQIVTPSDTLTGYLQATYDLGFLGNAQLYTEILGARRDSEQVSNRQLTIDYAQGSLLLPTNLRNGVFLGPQAGGVTGTANIAARAFVDYGTYNNYQKSDFVRATFGIRGDLPANWSYDVYALKSWSDVKYTSDLVLTSRLAQSLDVVQNTDGSFSCRNTLGGCVAAPALTASVISGDLPAAWKNWITQPVTGVTKFRETIISGTVNGPLFSLWADPIQVALGVEHRSDSINDQPAGDSVSGNLYSFTSSTPTVGKDSVTEAFGEIEIPIIKDKPFFNLLTINGSGRYTDYKSYGSQWTYKFGGLFRPVKWVGFRGSYGTSYRAPALAEQFLGSTSGFQSQNGDPCNNWNTLDSSLARYKNCQSEGLPTNFQATTSIQVNQKGGAESGLSAETSTAWTVGGVLEPTFGSMGRLSLSADYFDITVNNGVSQLSYSTILSQCYDNPDFKSASICSYVTRSTTSPYGLKVVTGYVNISTSKVAGWDFNLRYAVGAFRLNAQLTKFNERYTQTLPTDTIYDNVGALNNPAWTGTADAQYTIDRFTLRYGLDWIDGTYSSAEYMGQTQAARDTYIFQAPDYFLHSASIRYQAEKFSLILGVRNLMNTSPPYISSGAYNRVGNVPLYSGYDYMGRTVFINVSTRL